MRDRLVHHAVYRVLYPFFDKVFIADSYSCRIGKGTHRALNRFRAFGYRVSRNNTCTARVLKCDIKKFFASIDHEVLFGIMRRYISDAGVLWPIERVVKSFSSTASGKGLPLGNLTSQLLVNIYMNEFDQFVKHVLRVKYYIRYADDFAIFFEDREWLFALIPRIRGFLREKLKLELHPNKVSIKTVASGVDFLGWVHFFDHRILRTTTQRRMVKKLTGDVSRETAASYFGLLKHGNTHKIRNRLFNAEGARLASADFSCIILKNGCANNRTKLQGASAAGRKRRMG